MQITLSDIFNIIFIVIPIVLSIIALFQTSKQIKISNKQFVFQRRVEIYRLLGLLLAGEKSSYMYLSKKEGTLSQFLIVNLINNAWLESIGNNWVEVEETKEDHINILKKLEEIYNIGYECKFVFQEPYASILYKYFCKYSDTIRAIYRYRILERSNEKSGTVDDELVTESIKEINELAEQLKSLSSQINIDEIEKEIKL